MAAWEPWFTVVSNPAQVLVVRYSSSKPRTINVDIGMRMLRHSVIEAHGNQLDITGDARFDKNGEGGVRFRGLVKVMSDDGHVPSTVI